MAITNLTKSAVNAVPFTAKDYELRDAIVPGVLCKVTAGQQKKLTVALTVKIEAGLRHSRSLFRLSWP